MPGLFGSESIGDTIVGEIKMSCFNRLNQAPEKLLLVMRVKAFTFLYIALFLSRIAFGQEPLVWPNQYVVTFASPTIFPQEIAPNVDISGLGTTFAILDPFGPTSGLVVPLPAGQAFNLCDAMGPAALAAANIVNCTPNYLMTATDTPSDPYYLAGYQSDLPAIHALEAVNTQMSYLGGSPTSAPIAAVIDTGIDYNHQDLAANMWSNPGETSGNGLDDDADGFVDNMYGVDVVNGDGNPMDDHGHGTHCAGTIAAVRNNGVGMAGLATGTKLMGVKVLSSSGSGSFAGIIAGINWVTAKRRRGDNVRVINMSLGGQIPFSAAGPLCQAVRAAHDAGIAVVVAAGNSAANNDVSDYYPANCPQDNGDKGLSVAAVNNSGALAYFSNYGAASVQIAAPGVSTLSTYLNNAYVNMSGTSMAAPHVAGVAALLFETLSAGLVSPDDVINAIKAGARAVSGLQGKVSTGSMLDADGALNALISSSGSPPSDLPSPSPTPIPDTTSYTLSVATNGVGKKIFSGKNITATVKRSSSNSKISVVMYAEINGASCSFKTTAMAAGKSSLKYTLPLLPIKSTVTLTFSAFVDGMLKAGQTVTVNGSKLKSALNPSARNFMQKICSKLKSAKVQKARKANSRRR